MVDAFGRNALHWAVRGGFARLGGLEFEIVKRISAMPDVDVNRRDGDGETALLTAISLGRLDMVSELLGMKAIDVNVPGPEGITPLMRTIQYHQPEIIRALLNTKGQQVDAVDAKGWSALFYAVARGDKATIQFLLDRKARTNTVTADGRTLLHALFEPKSYRLTPDPANIEIVKMLLSRKDIDINKENDDGHTAMFLALAQDWPDFVKLLLAQPELDVNKKTRAGGYYLHRVIGLSNLRHGHEMAMMLLDREDIDVNVPYDSGESVVHMGWYNSGMGASGIELAKKILSRRPDVNRANNYGATPLVYNIRQDRPEMVQLLVGVKGIDLNRSDMSADRSPLGMALRSNRHEIVEILKKAGAREFRLVGDEERTPEGIPQALLQNPSASQAILFYREYLLNTNKSTLDLLRIEKKDSAVQQQEFILDEIIVEVGNSMLKYSSDQRKRAKITFAEIREHYRRHPRAKSNWFKALPDDKKANYAKVDAMMNEVLAGKYDREPDGELVNHPPMVPILILRDYMAKNTIKALAMIKAGKIADAEKFLKEIIGRSDSMGSFSQ